MFRIESLSGWEILDSRGRPTIAARIVVDGAVAEVSVPSGASTGAAEAMELRDGDAKRYRGLGTRQAAANVSGAIADAVAGRQFSNQQSLDDALIRLDGTPNKRRLGANAILAVSLAFARAVATARRVPLFQHFAEIAGNPDPHLPRSTINLFSGGKHAGGQVSIQDVLMVPMQSTMDDCLAAAFAVYYAAADLTGRKYDVRALKADEGGLAPPFPSIEAMFDDAVEAIRSAGLTPGKDVALAVDVASSHFYEAGKYHLSGTPLASEQMIRQLQSWIDNWPIISIEDGLAEEDWSHWPELRQALHPRAITLGDDFLCTHPSRVQRAIEAGACDALLLKVNQIGTLSEAAQSRNLAKKAAWKVVVSARSGETEDNWLADLACAWGDFIKIGSICQSERLAKYNRLLQIERENALTLQP